MDISFINANSHPFRDKNYRQELVRQWNDLRGEERLEYDYSFANFVEKMEKRSA